MKKDPGDGAFAFCNVVLVSAYLIFGHFNSIPP